MTIRVALVGLGVAAKSIWLPQLADHPAFELTAVVDPDHAARDGLDSGRLGVSSGIAVLTPSEVDLAVVAAPNHLHCELACALLAKGIPTFVEKPICLSTAEADRLRQAERDGGTVLLGGSAARYRADIRALYEVAGRLGRIRHVDLGWVRAGGVPGGWFTQRGLSGGGALIDLGWHLLDTVSPLLGGSAVAQAAGTLSADFLHDERHRVTWRADLGGGTLGDVEDTARGFLVTEDGVSVSLRAGWASHEPVDTTTIRVEGSEGTATLSCTFGFSTDRVGGPVLTHLRGGKSERVPVAAEPIGAEYRRQLDLIPDRLADPTCRGQAIQDAAWTVDAIERCYASAAVYV
ncbi:oxidoreductase [Amycolatopsis orientalis]|uniref:Oxidoreductase n=2 Tax=Actinomycetes TaxID=1760 RepID=A0A193BVA6_AMYOR|nr:Gfo/Idh/MocA family oxidoreductase [Amycolatopsis orientalis]ADI33757.1 oxidoreductase [Streptomyces sp. 3-9]ANN16103.1 oxidoreductase [Amycolatopsis orientalis]